MNDILTALHWRYATKHFDPNKKLTAEQLQMLTEALRLAPSSYGLQPWKFVVVTNAEVRARLREHAYGQPQITDASALIVLCSLKDIDAKYVKHYVDQVAQVRSVARDQLAGFENVMVEFVASLKTPEERKQWMKKQVYLALGTVLSAAAVNQIDACPMEGFDAAKFNEDLQLDQHGIESTVLCAVGFRAEHDPSADKPKVRFDEKDVIIRVE